MSLATNLKRLRDAAGMTQEELASAAGLKQNAISKYEKGKTKPDLKTVLRLATGLKSPLEPLVEGLDVKFDAFYQGFRMSITSDDESGAEAAEDGEQPFDVIVPGAPASLAGDSDDTAPDMASTFAALHRVAAELLSVISRLPTGPPPVARDLGSEVRERAAQRRARPRPKTPKATRPKER